MNLVPSINVDELNQRLQIVLDAQALAHRLSDACDPVIEITLASETWHFNLKYTGDMAEMEPTFRNPEPINDVFIDELIVAVKCMDAEIEASLRKLRQ